MNTILTAGLADGVEIGGRRYAVHTSFRNWLIIDGIIRKKKMTAGDMAYMLALAYRELPGSAEGAYEGIMKFYNPAEQKEKKKGKRKPEGTAKGFDFCNDSEIIFADFLRFYGINLITEDMHWHEFRALFYNLPGEARIKQIIDIRTMKLSGIKDKRMRAEYRRLKEEWALPDERSDEEKENDFASALW